MGYFVPMDCHVAGLLTMGNVIYQKPVPNLTSSRPGDFLPNFRKNLCLGNK